MNKYFLLFFINIMMIPSVFSQKTDASNIEAIYTMEIKIDYKKVLQNIPSNLRSQYEPIIKSEIDNGIFMNYLLKSNSKNSTFTLEEKINNNQGNTGIISQQMYMMDNKPTYKDFTLNPNIYYKEVDLGSKRIIIKDNLPDLKWKISREKSDVLGYEVTKANGFIKDSIEVTAWFSKNIPIKDGPYSFSGLPGLILKAEFEMNGAKIIYTLKELKTYDKELFINFPTKGDFMSEKQYEEFIKKFQKKIQEELNTGVDIK